MMNKFFHKQMSQVVIHWPRFDPRPPCEVSDQQNSTGTGFCESTLVFPVSFTCEQC